MMMMMIMVMLMLMLLLMLILMCMKAQPAKLNDAAVMPLAASSATDMNKLPGFPASVSKALCYRSAIS